MTIDELLQKKKELEDSVAKILEAFKADTGVRVSEIYIEVKSARVQDGRDFVTWSEVKAEITL